MKSYRRHTAEGADGSGNNGGRKGDRKSSKRTGETSGRGKAKTTSSSGDDEYNAEDDPNYVGVPRRRHEDNYMRLERETDNLARRLMLQRSAEHERGPDSRQYPPGGAYVHANGGNGLRYPSANTHLAHTSQLQITEGHHANYGRYPYHANANSHGFPAYDYSAPYHGIEGVRSDGNVYDRDDTYQEYRQREQYEQREQEDDLGENESGGWCHIRSDASHY